MCSKRVCSIEVCSNRVKDVINVCAVLEKELCRCVVKECVVLRCVVIE